MKTTTRLFLAGALLAASSAPLVAAAAVNVDVNIGVPGYYSYVAPQPTYYYPPSVYYAPAPRVYYTPAPLAYYAPAPYAHHHRGDRDWDRRWDRHYRHDDRRHW